MSQFNRYLWTGLVLGLAACGDDVTVTNPPEPVVPTPGVTSVSVAPDGATIVVNGKLGMTAAATLQPGAAAPTWSWSSSSTAVATVAGTTASAEVTAVAVGSAGIRATATSGTSSASGVATVTVVAAPVAPSCAISGVSVSPSSANLVVGQTVAVAANVTGTNCTAAQLGVNFSTSDNTVASVSATGVVTANAAGSVTITATSATDASKKAAMSVSIVAPQPATVSIQSVTQFATNVPVDLTNVGGQIEITLNVDPGSAPQVTKAQALINGVVVAEQVIPAASAAAAPSLAPQTLVLSTNTRQVKLANGLYTPVVFNGPGQITARIFTAASTNPAVSNAVPVVMQNADAVTPPTTFAATNASPSAKVGATTWRAGTITVSGAQYISFYPTGIDSLKWASSSCGSTGNMATGSATAGYALAGTFACTGVENAAVTPGAVTVWQTTPAPAADIVYIAATGLTQVGSAYTVDGSTRYNLLAFTFSTTPSVAIDNVGPTTTANEIGYVAGCSATIPAPGCWVNASYNLLGDFTHADAGSGVAASTAAVWTRSATPACTSTAFDVTTAADNASPTTYDVCGNATDSLGNVGTKVAGNNKFSVDNVAPTIDFNGSYADDDVNPAEIDDLTGIGTLDYEVQDNMAGLEATALSITYARTLNHSGTVVTSGVNSCPPGAGWATLTGSGVNPLTMVTPVDLSTFCTKPGEQRFTASATDRAGNTSGTIVRALEYNPVAPTVNAVNIVPNYAAGADVGIDVLASDDEDLASGELWLHTTTNDGNHIRVIFGPDGGFFTGIWGSDWDGSLFLNTTLGTSSRLTLGSAYSLKGYVENTGNFSAGQAPIDTISVKVYDTFGKSGATSVALNSAFVTASSYAGSGAGSNPWSAGLGNITGFNLAALPGDATSCSFIYGTPTNNPEVLTRLWTVNEDTSAPGLNYYTVLGDINATPVLVSDNGIERLYRYTFSTTATCATLGINQIFTIKSGVAAILF